MLVCLWLIEVRSYCLMFIVWCCLCLFVFVRCCCLLCVFDWCVLFFVGVVRWLLLLLSCWFVFIVGGLLVVVRGVFLLFIVDCWSFVFVVVFVCCLFGRCLMFGAFSLFVLDYVRYCSLCIVCGVFVAVCSLCIFDCSSSLLFVASWL